MKNIIINTVLLITIGCTISISVAAAYNATYNNGAISTNKTLALETQEFFERFKYGKGRETKDTKIGYVQSLPKGTIPDVIITVIRFLLGIAGALALIAFSYAGIMFITAQGDETQLTKAKKLIFISILGLAIIATSYAIVLGVSQLKF